MSAHSRFWSDFVRVLMICCLAGAGSERGFAQVVPEPGAVPAVLLSDLHFDPFHDPAKTPLLVKAPLEEWEGILKSPETPTQAADFSAVQRACSVKRPELMDTPYALLISALAAAKKAVPDVRFVIVSGDLLVHALDCRYRAAMKLPPATSDDQSVSTAFSEKTTVFVMNKLEREFAGIPVYLALGNNDSRCNHNRLDVGDEYLKKTGQAAIDGLVGVSEAERKQALETYESAGYYAVTMTAPMKRTRLLVVDDIYMMSKFATCEANDKDHHGADEQIAWLTKELDDARRRDERVWVMGHLPPAVNPTSTMAKWMVMCGNGNAETYLSSDALTKAMVSHADVVRLALFGHTHMDEMHLLGDKEAGVPVKVVASISPVIGNRPSFAVGMVAPSTATLMDYSVFVASNTTGVGTTWTKEYGFGETYHESGFTARALDDLIGRFRADTAGTGAESQAYQTHFFKGMAPFPLGPLWLGYVCSMDHSTAEGFKACVCGK